MTHSKRFINFAILSVLLAASAPLYALDLVKIGVPAATYAPLAPVYMAQELGYYKDAGVQVEITAYRGGAMAQQMIAAGEADMIYHFPTGVALAVKKGIKEKIVGAAGLTAGGWHLVVVKDSPIKSLADIAGKKVGVTAKGSSTDFFAMWAARKAGVEIQTIPLGFGAMIPALKGGQLDACVLAPPLSQQMFVTGEGRSIADFSKDVGISLPELWVASQATIDQRPKAVEGVLKAIYRATRYMQLPQNRAYTLKFLKQHTRESNDKVNELVFEAAITKLATQATIKPEWLKAAMALAVGTGVENMRPEEFVTDKFFNVQAD